MFLLLGVPFFVAGWFFTSSSYPEERPSPTPAPVAAVVLTTPAPAPRAATPPPANAEPATYGDAVNAAQHAAVALYPDLGRRGTHFNTRFVAAYRRLKIDDPGFFSDPEWPLHLADEIARTPPEPP